MTSSDRRLAVLKFFDQNTLKNFEENLKAIAEKEETVDFCSGFKKEDFTQVLFKEE